jgi:Ca2+-binding RTX toxin-like protein
MGFGTDIITVKVASGALTFVHGTDTAVGTANAAAAATGIAGDYLTSVGLIDTDNDAVFTSADDIVINFTSPNAAVTEARFEASLAYEVTLAAAADFTSGGQNDTITGSTGANVISSGAGDDTINGAGAKDTITTGTGTDTITANGAADSVAASATALSANIAATNTLTFATGAADNVDRITDFTAGTDNLDFTTAATAPTSLVGLGKTTALADDTTFVAYGTYVVGTGVFTIAAAFNATTAADALVVEGDGTLTPTNETGYTVLDNLSAALVAADIV